MFSLAAATVVASALAGPARADLFHFSTGDPDGLVGTATRPESAGKIEIESADDFVTTSSTLIDHATFTGLLPAGASISDISRVVVEIYRVFPKDSDTNRTPEVVTRVNSPSDVAIDSRDSSAGGLTFSASVLNANFSVANTVVNGINKAPNQFTGGEGPASGQEVQIDVKLSQVFDLPADHYFFVPQVELNNSGDFLWLSAPKPIVAPGTDFPPGFTDLQSWIRDENLQPDWSRIGTDIIGGNPVPTFNAAFSIDGVTVPEPGSVLLLGLGGFGLLGARMRSTKVRRPN